VIVDGTSCLLKLPAVLDDGPKACRWRCKTCWEFAINSKNDREPGRTLKSNQMNTAWKHFATDEHFNAHLAVNRLTQQQKHARVVQMIPKLNAILARKKPATNKRKADKRFFTTQDVMALQHQVSIDVDAAFRQAFLYGMQGNVRNAVAVEEAPIVPMHPVPHTGTPMAHPGQEIRAVPPTMDFQRHPPSMQAPTMSDFEKAFQRTQHKSNLFHSFQQPKS
jgi:hypothetical protein